MYIIHLGFGDLWKYSDFADYNEGYSIGPNFLYALFVYGIGADTIANPVLVALAVFFSALIDTASIYLFQQHFKIKTFTIFMYLVFCCHPYFSFYTFRLDTLFFSKLACLSFLYWLFYRDLIKTEIIKYLILFLSMFRLSSLIFLLPIIFKDLFLLNSKNIIQLISIASVSAMVLFLNTGYVGIVFSAAKNLNWTLNYTQSIVGEFGFLVDYIIHYIIRFFLLLGGREAIYAYQIEYFISSEAVVLEVVAFFTLAFFHFICFLSFLLFSKKKMVLIPVLLSLSLLVLCLFTVGHMRYLVGYYPIILLGWLLIGAQTKASECKQ